MENRVGDKLPSKPTIEGIVNSILFARSTLAKYGVELNAEERKHATRFRSGGERIVRIIAELAEAKNVSIPRFPVADMLRDLELIERLERVNQEVEALARLAGDSTLQAKSECWWAAQAYYSVLTDMARADPSIETRLADVVEFFALGRRGAPSTEGTPTGGNPNGGTNGGAEPAR